MNLSKKKKMYTNKKNNLYNLKSLKNNKNIVKKSALRKKMVGGGKKTPEEKAAAAQEKKRKEEQKATAAQEKEDKKKAEADQKAEAATAKKNKEVDEVKNIMVTVLENYIHTEHFPNIENYEFYFTNYGNNYLIHTKKHLTGVEITTIKNTTSTLKINGMGRDLKNGIFKESKITEELKKLEVKNFVHTSLPLPEFNWWKQKQLYIYKDSSDQYFIYSSKSPKSPKKIINIIIDDGFGNVIINGDQYTDVYTTQDAENDSKKTKATTYITNNLKNYVHNGANQKLTGDDDFYFTNKGSNYLIHTKGEAKGVIINTIEIEGKKVTINGDERDLTNGIFRKETLKKIFNENNLMNYVHKHTFQINDNEFYFTNKSGNYFIYTTNESEGVIIKNIEINDDENVTINGTKRKLGNGIFSNDALGTIFKDKANKLTDYVHTTENPEFSNSGKKFYIFNDTTGKYFIHTSDNSEIIKCIFVTSPGQFRINNHEKIYYQKDGYKTTDAKKDETVQKSDLKTNMDTLFSGQLKNYIHKDRIPSEVEEDISNTNLFYFIKGSTMDASTPADNYYFYNSDNLYKSGMITKRKKDKKVIDIKLFEDGTKCYVTYLDKTSKKTITSEVEVKNAAPNKETTQKLLQSIDRSTNTENLKPTGKKPDKKLLIKDRSFFFYLKKEYLFLCYLYNNIYYNILVNEITIDNTTITINGEHEFNTFDGINITSTSTKNNAAASAAEAAPESQLGIVVKVKRETTPKEILNSITQIIDKQIKSLEEDTNDNAHKSAKLAALGESGSPASGTPGETKSGSEDGSDDDGDSGSDDAEF